MESSDINETVNGPGEAEENDYEESIFFTQKPQTSNSQPDATRSPRCSQRSKPLSPRLFESGSSSEDEVPREKGKSSRTRLNYLPKYNFPFFNQRNSYSSEHDGSICSARNRAIHYSAVAGFFNCFGEMWSNGKRRKSFESTLSTVDADDEEITPITEDEKSDEEDVKIIDKRQFVYSLKPKIKKGLQSWCEMAETTKPTKTRKMSQATPPSNEAEALPYEHPDNSAATLLEDHRIEMCSLDQSDPESQSILQNNPLDLSGRPCDNIYNANEQVSTKKNEKDAKPENKNPLPSQESVNLFEDYITDCPLLCRRKDKTPRKTNSPKINSDGAKKPLQGKCAMETTKNPKKDTPGQRLHEDAELLSCPNVEDHSEGTVHKKKKKKHEKKKAEKEHNGSIFDPLPVLELNNIPAVVESDTSDELKREKNQTAARDSDEDVPLNYTGKNGSSGLVECGEKCELVNDDYSATDCITRKRKSVSARKKKRQVPFIVETGENVTLHLSLSGDGHGADECGISTNDVESATTNGPLHETELCNKVKKKKKRKEKGEFVNAIDHAEATEITNMNKCSKSNDWDNSDVMQAPSDEDVHVKKKSCKSIERAAPAGVKEGAILSPNVSACSERKHQKKKRQCFDGVETELEPSTGKRKHKRMSTSHELSQPSCKVKKTLYNPNETFMGSF